jgi:hypothetical protein
MRDVSFCLCAPVFVTSNNIIFEVHSSSPRNLHAHKTVNKRKFCAVNHKTERPARLRKWNVCRCCPSLRSWQICFVFFDCHVVIMKLVHLSCLCCSSVTQFANTHTVCLSSSVQSIFIISQTFPDMSYSLNKMQENAKKTGLPYWPVFLSLRVDSQKLLDQLPLNLKWSLSVGATLLASY